MEGMVEDMIRRRREVEEKKYVQIISKMEGMVEDMRRRLREVEENLKEEEEVLATTQARLFCLGPMIGVDLITLRVQSQNEEDIFYLMGTNLQLGHLMNDYCNRKGLGWKTIRFVFDGRRVKQNHTAEEMEMEDEDIIDTFSDQYSG